MAQRACTQLGPDPDSDSDFTPGVYVPEASKTRKQGSPAKRKRRSEVLADLTGRAKRKSTNAFVLGQAILMTQIPFW